MKKVLSLSFLFLASVLIFCNLQTANAAVVMGTVSTDSQYQGSLDFNNDGTADFYFQSTSTYTDIDIVNCVVMFQWNNVNNIWTIGNVNQGVPGWDCVKDIAPNTQIGASGNWQSQGDAYLFDMENDIPLLPVGEDSYLGFRFSANGNTYYGWAKVRMTGSASTGFTAQWLECAYESTPNTPIAAGATPTGIEENALNTISVYPNPVTDFVTVSNVSNEQIAVYDFNGRQVNTEIRYENANAIIDFKSLCAGTYFIRMDGRSAKVIKK
ncbi:MAG: T9SS type A sorting domain-containing protein [Bacteroidales bacterium]|nr:T9SS type A sorting domain-containing protein [Bacteroidales bacterium]